ncbi:hypothetical protein DL95DRAFT_411705 [Leptodontidium sp. 2 PMI_412]|nr:hypothetical protein DL95DRAFT_411705 [Leptodontidium sp. 2 PMI_412]
MSLVEPVAGRLTDAAVKLFMVGSIAATAAGLTASTTSWFLQTFASPKPPSNVDFSSTPIHEGVFKEAGGAIYLLEVAANLSIVPQLLQQSKSSVLNAADIIAGSSLEDKDLLAAEYTRLFGDTDELTEVSQDWNSGADVLVADFETLLSMALSQVGAIRTHVDFQDSIYVVVSQLCITMCLDNAMPVYFHEHECKLSGTSAAATMAGVLCLDTSMTIPDLVCSPLLKLMPGIKLYMDEVADSRVNAVQRLRQFLEALDGQMLMEAKIWQPNSLLDRIGFSYGLIESPVGLRRDHISLNRTVILNDVALQMFTQADDVLNAWKRDIEGVLRSLQNFEHLADKGWRGAWQDMQDWDDLRADFEKLRPLVTALARAQTRMTAKIKDREMSFNEAMEACFAEAKRPGRKVKFDWGACYDERELLLWGGELGA